MSRAQIAGALAWILLWGASALAGGVPEDDGGLSAATKRLASLTWLEGHWSGALKDSRFEARYSGVDGGAVMSTNKLIGPQGELRSMEFEHFLIHEGDVIMQPYPGGEKSPIFFTLTELDRESRRAVFENPEHDFPQILTYQRLDDSTLNIKIQARRDGELRGWEVTLRRVTP